eukprot:TRINITY_DN5812_c1_g1_i2.p1 TRINITY_DN5812_c1_g1~~TRINITY_DN5812_c1_g1_i2.p1  ORF type:complete len:284 (+),score=54.70 TRINITY_DN5812_c1_g1_i2:190-1041(+)
MSDAAPRPPQRRLTPAEDFGIGAVTGMAEVFIMQPTAYWKVELQQQRFTVARAFNPRYAYRGVFVAALAMTPVSSTQFAVLGLSQRSLQGSELPYIAQGIVTGAACGFGSSLIMGFSNLIEINQQKHGGTFVGMGRRILGEYGLRGIFIGYGLCGLRESFFSCGCYCLLPFLSGVIQRERPEMSEKQASGAAALASGLFSTFLSHPVDTVKTRIQGDTFPVQPGDVRKYINVKSVLVDMRRQGNVWQQLFAGLPPRLMRICCAMFIYNELKGYFETTVRRLRD